MKTRGCLVRSPTTGPSVLFALLVALPLVSAVPALAGPTDVTLQWNANTDADLAGYQIAYGSSPGSHPNLIDAGNVTTYTVPGLVTGNTYYFVVQAYDRAKNFSSNSAEVSGVAGAAPLLTLSIGESPDPVQAGTDLTYTLSYANTGSASATSVVVTDTIPANTTFVSANAGGVRSGSTVTWSIGAVAAGGTGAVQLVAHVASPLANGTTLGNSGANIDSAQTTPVTAATATTTVSSAPVLTISKTDGPDPVAAGANLTYTLNWSNTGNMNASGVVVTDTLPANTTFVSATASGTRSGSVVTWNVGALNASAGGSAQLVVKVNSPLANGTTLTNSTYAIDSNETSPVAGGAVTTTVSSVPVLTISKTDGPDPVLAGANLTYTLNWSNTGNQDATSLVVTDTVPANTTFVSATGGGTESGGVVTWTAPTLAAGASGSAQLVVRVTSPLANGTVLTNNSYSADCAETSPVNGAAVTTTVTSSPVLTVSATDAPDPVPAGSDLTWTIAYANNGNADGTTTVLSATLPANTTFVSATNGGTRTGSVVTWSLGTLTPGASGSVQLAAHVTSPLANGTVITLATYSIDSAQTNPVAGAGVTTTVVSSPSLTLTQSDAPDPVNAGSNLTYTFAYTNGGNANATSTVLSEPLPANTTYVTSSPAGTVSAGMVNWNLGTVAGGASGSVSLTVKVASPLANGTLLTSAPTIDCAETTAVAAAPISTAVGSSPVLNMTVTDSPDPVAAGADLTYTIGVTNTGNANATSTVLTAAVPANATFVSATAGGTASAGTVTWNLGAVNVSGSTSVQLVVKVASPLANGTTLASGALSIDCAETAPVSGPTVTTAVTSAPVMSVTATDSPDPVQAGSSITWTLAYANNGNADATGVVVSDTLPANTTFVSATGGGVVSGSVVTWNIGALLAGGSGAVTVTARVTSPLNNGTLISHGTYSVDSAQTNPVNGPAVTTTVASTPVLSLAMTGTPDPVNSGATLTYTLSWSNTGNMIATGAVLTDPIPTNTTFVSATGGGTVSGGTVTWNLGTLNAGANGSVTLVVRVVTPLNDGTVITNSGESLDSAQTNPVTAANVQSTVRSSPTLGLTLTDGPDPVQAGANLTYTLAYSNTGSASATSTTLTATLPSNTSFVSASGGGTRSGSTVTWSLGTLAVGVNASVQLVVQVTSPLVNGTAIGAGPFSIDCAETAAVSSPAATTTVISAPAISLAQTDSPDPVAAGATLTYTLSYSNSGNANATSVVLTDTIPASTSFVSATGSGTLNGSTVTWPIGTLAAGGQGSVQLTVQVASPMTNGASLPSGTMTFDSAETVAVTGPVIATTVTSSPVLTVLASDGADPVGAGTNLTYTLTYANGGNAIATGTIVSAAVPADTTFVSAANGGVYSAGTVSWSLGNLSPNVFGTVSFTVRVTSPLPNGTILTLGTYSIDSNQTAATAGPAITTTVSSSAALTLQVSDSPDPVLASNTITYTVSYSNTGNAPADGVVVTASIPANTTFVSSTGGAVLAGSQVSWDLGTLNAGAGGSVQMVVQVSPAATSGTIITASGWTIDSNDTTPVTAAAANTSVTEASAPVITSAVEVVTNSIYLVRGATQFVELTGTAFLNGAVINISPDVSAGTTAVTGSTELTAPVTIANGATLGPRTVTLINPNNKMGSLADAFQVVKKSDVNNDCKTDGIDLNALARSWNDATSDAGYNVTVDYDGDGYVGPDDLAIFVKQFGRSQPGCP
ncbi:MAG TPA: fibronectin type III domain-containing protein [Candidatus Polarisedimenticolia bacterium]|nr:fibronectin type III domain-containing protein [Candidatus Polarisedimenticolia bacterium]